MRTFAFWSLILWFVLICEQTRSDLFPTGALVIPVAVGCTFSLRNGLGIMIAGLAMIVSWILDGRGAPLEIFGVLFISSALITGKRRPGEIEVRRSRWLSPVSVTVVGEVLLVVSLTLWGTVMEPGIAVASRLLVAVPCVLLIAFLSRVFDELEVRRPVSV